MSNRPTDGGDRRHGEQPTSEPVPVPVSVDDVLADRIELLCRAQQLRERDVVSGLLRYGLIHYEDALDECGPNSGTGYAVE